MTGSGPRIKFLIAAYRSPAAAERLADRVGQIPSSSVRIQWDIAHHGSASGLSGRHELAFTREPYGWGGWGQVEGLLGSMYAIERDAFDWLVVLTGSDYPIRPVSELQSMLSSTEHALFLQTPEGGTVLPPQGPMREWSYLQRRYFCHYRWFPQTAWARLGTRGQRAISKAAQQSLHLVRRGNGPFVQRRPRGFSPALAWRARSHPFTDARPCRKGSDWFALSRPVFDDLVRRSREDSALAEYYRHTYIPSESYFHTLLLPRWEDENAGVNLHYRRFTVSSAHPDTLTMDDLGVLASSGQYFARHFDPTDIELFDTIDREFLG